MMNKAQKALVQISFLVGISKKQVVNRSFGEDVYLNF